MLLSELIYQLQNLNKLEFELANKAKVPPHFHITEMGFINKKYTDCGNTFREENYFTFQLWYSTDVEHRLSTNKFLFIINSIINTSIFEDLEVLVEYQMEQTIGKFNLEIENDIFVLQPTFTMCLAREQCRIQPTKKKLVLSELQNQKNECNPNLGCC